MIDDVSKQLVFILVVWAFTCPQLLLGDESRSSTLNDPASLAYDSIFTFSTTRSGADIQQVSVRSANWRDFCHQSESRHRCETRLKHEMLYYGLKKLQASISECAKKPLSIEALKLSLNFTTDPSEPDQKLLVIRSPTDKYLSDTVRRKC